MVIIFDYGQVGQEDGLGVQGLRGPPVRQEHGVQAAWRAERLWPEQSQPYSCTLGASGGSCEPAEVLQSLGRHWGAVFGEWKKS